MSTAGAERKQGLPSADAAHGGGLPSVMRRSRGVLLTAGAAVGVFVLTLLWARPDPVSDADRARVLDAASAPSKVPAPAGDTAANGMSPGAGVRAAALADVSVPTSRNDPNEEPHDQGARGDARYPVYDENAPSAVPPAEDADKAELASAHPADQRAADLRAPTPAGAEERRLAELGETLRTDEFARNRLLAVNELRKLGASPHWSARALEILRASQNDKDPNVAASARDAIAQLAR